MDSHECPTTEKTCSKCGIVRPIDEYYWQRTRKRYFAQCKTCYSETTRKTYLKRKDRVLELQSKRRVEKADEISAYQAEWYQRNRARVLEQIKEYRSDPKVLQREKKRLAESYKRRKHEIYEKVKARKESDPEYVEMLRKHSLAHYYRHHEKVVRRQRKQGSKRRAQKLNASPAWADHRKIGTVYDKARDISLETGVQHHVDHIVPLLHPKVCGLHVHFNLAILEGGENSRKSNKFKVG